MIAYPWSAVTTVSCGDSIAVNTGFFGEVFFDAYIMDTTGDSTLLRSRTKLQGSTVWIKVTPSVTTFYRVHFSDSNGASPQYLGYKEVEIKVISNSSAAITCLTTDAVCGGNVELYSLADGARYDWIGLSRNGTERRFDGIDTNVVVDNPDDTTEYTVYVYGSDTNCYVERNITVEVPPFEPRANSKSLEICEGTSTELYVTGGRSCAWWDPLIGEVSDTVEIRPLVNTTYGVMIYADTGYNGCSDLKTIDIAVNPCRNAVYFANAISLNGTNKVFKPIGDQDYRKTYQLVIYNRWGQQIFESHSFDEGWDGTHNGESVAPGVYVYKFTITYRRDVVEKTGTITVIQ
ncbi:hypothetical protein FACS1894201_00370 [Bacteroidia bacterium]|nr:hypothetical protein FACS1894201_00370 [Bacteroidia bacterium]